MEALGSNGVNKLLTLLKGIINKINVGFDYIPNIAGKTSNLDAGNNPLISVCDNTATGFPSDLGSKAIVLNLDPSNSQYSWDPACQLALGRVTDKIAIRKSYSSYSNPWVYLNLGQLYASTSVYLNACDVNAGMGSGNTWRPTVIRKYIEFTIICGKANSSNSNNIIYPQIYNIPSQVLNYSSSIMIPQVFDDNASVIATGLKITIITKENGSSDEGATITLKSGGCRVLIIAKSYS